MENIIIKGIHASRYLASWYKEGGTRRDFVKWLRSLSIDGEPLSEDEIRKIRNFAENGKLELEVSAEAFIENQKWA